ncbi:MAG: ABC transporter permease subunit, partial [Actinomycetota bacterium]|nr:ABC transporter permease subunit [Actinomycetota bacterium]
YTLPLVKMTMAVPALCWVLFSILWFANVEYRIAFVLVAVCVPVFLIDTLDAIKAIPRGLHEVALSFRPTSLQYYGKLVLPSLVPAILTSWKINLSLAVRVVTVAELVGAVSGVGFALNVSAQTFSVADVFAWTIVLVALLLAMQGALGHIERVALRWRA